MLEAEAVLGIINLYQQGIVELLHSDALRYEIEQIPNDQRKVFATETLQDATEYISFTDGIVLRAKVLEQVNIKPLDALHVACAEAAEAVYFCTCDDRLIKRLKGVSGLVVKVKVVTPLELIQEVLS
jgi:predicted nucleic acid-binding protein